MQFGFVQQKKFGVLEGAYSLVTDREVLDSQITATDAEATLLASFFGKEAIHVGNVKSGKAASAKPFRLYPSGDLIFLNLVYPKPDKSELRLYLSRKAGFKPNAGQVWFLFVKDGCIWIGALDESVWRNENAFLNAPLETEDEFQEAVIDPKQTKPSISQIARWDRDPKIAKRRMEISRYKCEYDSGHNLFISRHKGVPFLEPHHLIPISLQARFPEKRLDALQNVFCLCPYCHSAVHHAESRYVRDILTGLSNKHEMVLARYGLDLEGLFRLYAVEDIV